LQARWVPIRHYNDSSIPSGKLIEPIYTVLPLCEDYPESLLEHHNPSIEQDALYPDEVSWHNPSNQSKGAPGGRTKRPTLDEDSGLALAW